MFRTTITLLCLLTLSACVSKGTYLEKQEEAALLRETLQQLEEQYQQQAERNQQLLKDRTQLNQQLTDAIEEGSTLRQDMLRARADRERAERLFETRNTEAGKTLTERRREIDALTETNRQLSAQLDQERQMRQAQVQEIKGTYDELVGLLESEIAAGEVTISELEGKLTVNMVEQILFDSGRAEVKRQGLKVLRQVGEVLHNVANKMIRVEGHTDNIPISPRLRSTFTSNWELSAARALNVVHFLEEQVGIPGERLLAAAFGEHQPLASNQTREGRAANRRIQIVLVPNE